MSEKMTRSQWIVETMSRAVAELANIEKPRMFQGVLRDVIIAADVLVERGYLEGEEAASKLDESIRRAYATGREQGAKEAMIGAGKP